MQTTIAKSLKLELVFGSSTFITILTPISEVLQFKTWLLDLKEEYKNATHYCYAYRIKNMEKASDDGEPNGSAGMPLLYNLQMNNLQDVAIVVIRYFKGSKLGLGPLTRAYGECAKTAIKEAELCQIVETVAIPVEIPAQFYGQVYHALKNIPDILEMHFADHESVSADIRGTITLPKGPKLPEKLTEFHQRGLIKLNFIP